MDPQIDLIADLNAEDDEGLGWSTLERPGPPSPHRGLPRVMWTRSRVFER